MSASKDKKTRQEQAGIGKPRTAREIQQRKEERRSNILYATIAILFVVVAVITITWKSGIVQRKATAVTIKGVNYSSAEVDYYYRSTYQNFLSQYSSYLSYIGLDTSKNLKDQTCPMDTEGGSWYDYFMDQSLTKMSSIHALCDAAAADNFTWNDDMQSQFDKAMSSLSSTVDTYNSTYNSSLTVKSYLKAVFGSIMTQDVYEEQLKLSILAQAYSDKYTNGLTYTTSDLTTAYNEDPNAYDEVDYESIRIDGSVQTAADSSASGSAASSSAASSSAASSSAASEPTDEEKAAALESAKELANSFYSQYQSGASLSDLAKGNDLATYTGGVVGTYSDNVLMNWLFDSSRKAGDSAVLADEDNSAYYVVVFSSRYRYDYNTVDVRHILIKPETSTLSEGDDGYEEDVAQKKADAQKKAEDLLAEWKAGAATEDSFAELANKNSEDTGSNTTGGLYEHVYKGEMVTEFNDWCFDKARKSGDTGIVYSESTGYHIIYFVGTDLPYWQVQVTNALQTKDYNDWYSSVTKGYDATQHSFGMSFVN